MSKDAGMSEI